MVYHMVYDDVYHTVYGYGKPSLLQLIFFSNRG